MPFSKINITLTAAQMKTVANAIDTVINALPVKFNLTKKERQELKNIDDVRYPYVKRGIEIHGPNNPKLVSELVGTLAEATNDFTFFDQLQTHILRLLQAVEIYQDTQHVAGAEAYAWLRELYRTAQVGAENQVPGADAVVDDLKTLFEKQGVGSHVEEPEISQPV